MKTILPPYWKVYAALLVIFASGSTLGYVTGQRNTAPPATALPAPPAVDDATSQWADKALDGLGATLALTPEQAAALRPVLERTGKKVFRQRDRALFQIYLEVLSVHDEIAPYLEPGQQKILAKGKENMHLIIESRFKSLIDQPAGSPVKSD